MDAPVVRVSRGLKRFAVLTLAAGVVVIDSASFFWSMACDLLLVAALVVVTKIPTK